jgi:membrane protein YqaA with SNARE-associated domain
MKNVIDGYLILAYLAAQEMQQQLERGDSDNAGSTMRTLGIVVLVVAVVALIGAAVYTLAGVVSGNISLTKYTFLP